MIPSANLYGVVVAFGAWRWNVATRALVKRMEAAGVLNGVARHHTRDIIKHPNRVIKVHDLNLTDITGPGPGGSGLWRMPISKECSYLVTGLQREGFSGGWLE